MNKLSIIILNYNTKKLTLDCLESIDAKTPQKNTSIWLIDNASKDDSVEAVVKKYPNVNVVRSKSNMGFSKGNNLGIKKAFEKSSYCLLLNSDTIANPKSINKLVNFSKDNNYDIVSCKLLNPDGSFQPNAGDLPTIIPVIGWLSNLDSIFNGISSFHQRDEKYYRHNRETGWVSGSAMLVKSDVFSKIGFFDENIFMYAEDVDICWRAQKKGLKVGWTKDTSIIHIGGASTTKPKYNQWLGEFRGLIYLYKKHYGSVQSMLLKILIYIFSSMRVIAFYLKGNKEYAKTYAKIINNL